MTATDRTDATDEEFHARVAVFEAAPVPPEVDAATVEKVARAMVESVGYPWPEGDGAWSQHEREFYRTLAVAALDALPVSPAEAAMRVQSEFDQSRRVLADAIRRHGLASPDEAIDLMAYKIAIDVVATPAWPSR